jgi:hypothetical protein
MDRSIHSLDALTQELEDVLRSLKAELQLASTLLTNPRDDESMLKLVKLKHESMHRASELCGILSECALKTQIRLTQSQSFVPKLHSQTQTTKKRVEFRLTGPRLV